MKNHHTLITLAVLGVVFLWWRKTKNMANNNIILAGQSDGNPNTDQPVKSLPPVFGASSVPGAASADDNYTPGGNAQSTLSMSFQGPARAGTYFQDYQS